MHAIIRIEGPERYIYIYTPSRFSPSVTERSKLSAAGWPRRQKVERPGRLPEEEEDGKRARKGEKREQKRRSSARRRVVYCERARTERRKKTEREEREKKKKVHFPNNVPGSTGVKLG